MSSSGSWTNRTRILAQTKPLKVQAPKTKAVYNPMLPVANCSRDFTPIEYFSSQCCNLQPGKFRTA